MWEPRQERSTETAAVSASGRDSLPAWDLRIWLVAIPLALIVIYAFIPILNNGFVDWDDQQNFLENPSFRGLGAAQVRWAWTTFWVGVYQPLAWLLFETEYVFWQLDPWGYHFTSLVLQVADAVVLYALTVSLLVRCRVDCCLESPLICSLSAGLATALFAVHPLRVEAVAWVSCQPYLPCILFSMLAVLAYFRAFPGDSSPRWDWLVGSFLLFVVALLFKAVAVSLPVVLLILDYYPLRRIPDETGRWFGASVRSALWEKVPFMLTSLLFMGLAIAAKPQSRFPVEHYGASEGIARACYGTWFYMFKALFPLELVAFYPSPRNVNWLSLPFSVSILATVTMTVGLYLLRRRWPGLLAAWLCYLVILAPNSGIIHISGQIAADRYSYMSMLSCVTVVAAGFCVLWRMSSRWHPDAPIGVIALGFGAVVGLTTMTRSQCKTWRDTDVLWTHALTHGAFTSSEVHNNLGTFASRQKRYALAEAHLLQAMQLNPEFRPAHYNLGLVFVQRGNYEGARDQFVEAIRLQPDDPKAYNAGAMVMAACPDAKFRDGKEAVRWATRACELTEWQNATILDTLAAAQAESGDFDAAVKSQERAIELLKDDPRQADFRSRLALFQAKKPYREGAPRPAASEARP